MGAHEGCDGFWRAMAVRGNHRVGIGDVQLQLPAGLIDLAGACERFRHLDRLPKMRDRLLERRTVKRKVARLPPPFDGKIVEPSLCQMMRDDFGLGGRASRIVTQNLSGAAVKRMPAAPEQAVVGYVLDQRMLEAIGRLSAGPFDEQEVRVDKPIEPEF